MLLIADRSHFAIRRLSCSSLSPCNLHERDDCVLYIFFALLHLITICFVVSWVFLRVGRSSVIVMRRLSPLMDALRRLCFTSSTSVISNFRTSFTVVVINSIQFNSIHFNSRRRNGCPYSPVSLLVQLLSIGQPIVLTWFLISYCL